MLFSFPSLTARRRGKFALSRASSPLLLMAATLHCTHQRIWGSGIAKQQAGQEKNFAENEEAFVRLPPSLSTGGGVPPDRYGDYQFSSYHS